MEGMSAITTSEATSWYVPDTSMKRAIHRADIMFRKPWVTRHTAPEITPVAWHATDCTKTLACGKACNRLHQDIGMWHGMQQTASTDCIKKLACGTVCNLMAWHADMP